MTGRPRRPARYDLPGDADEWDCRSQLNTKRAIASMVRGTRNVEYEAGDNSPRNGRSRENSISRQPNPVHSRTIPGGTRHLIQSLASGNPTHSRSGHQGVRPDQDGWQPASKPQRIGKQNFGSSLSLPVSERFPKKSKGRSKNWSNQSILVTKLVSVDDWNALASLDNSMRILIKLQDLESSWVNNFQTDAPFEVLDVAFKIFNSIEVTHRYGRLALMKSLFTDLFMKRIVLLIVQCKREWLQRGVAKIVSFVGQLRCNVEFILSSDATFHELETLKAGIKNIIDACENTLIGIGAVLDQQGCPDESIDKEVALVRGLSQIRVAEMLALDEPLHPEDFLKLYNVMPNITHGSYESDGHYVQTHFGLLKEDFQSTLRDGVEQYRMDPKKRNFSIWAYENVKVERCFQQNEANYNKIKVVNKALFKVTFPKCAYFSQVNWKFAKRFMFRSLVVLTTDNFQTTHLALIEERNITDAKKISILVSFLSPLPNAVEEREFLLVESKAFYEPYMNSMKVMMRMAKIGLPMKKYIVQADTSHALPAYLTPETTYRIGSYDVKLATELSWPTAEEMGLNESQRTAFFNALTSEMALIQGPPGTGKTFLAFKIIETLLENRKCSYGDGPIMIVCYKNHSLDQILEGLVAKNTRVIRIGSRSKNRALQFTFNVNALPPPPRFGSLAIEKDEIEDKLQEHLRLIRWGANAVTLIKARIGIVDLEVLKEYGVVSERIELNLTEWLLELLEGAGEVRLQDITAICSAIGNLPSIQNMGYERLRMLFSENLLTNGRRLIQTETRLNSLGRYDEVDMEEYYHLEESLWTELGGFSRLHCGLFMKIDPTYCPKINSNDPQQQWTKYFELDLEERWALYNSWEADLIQAIEKKQFHLHNQVLEIQDHLEVYEELVMSQKLKCERPPVIGITTSGASKHYAALAEVGAKIVIVEEAAEVLEANVITALSTKCEHLILIGDHLQLRPTTANHVLGSQYRMNVSLFERMIKNDIKWSCLSTQHRMRPEIAALISPSIYQNLTNSDSVAMYPNVVGTQKNVYFFTHSEPEQVAFDGESKFNPKEGEMIVAICNYLLQQGHDPTGITILSTYLEQDRFIKKTIERHKSIELKRVLCAVVDNYQGEENTIILLSLVRSNQYGDVGFLSSKNRVCVALSRAKHGLFMFGNMPCLSKKEPTIWTEINEVLLGQGSIGPTFPLKCTRHGNITEVRTPQDVSLLEHAGCRESCEAALPCGHTCHVMCHGLDQMHLNEFKCQEKCLKKCPNGHICQAPCRESCPPCPQKIPKLLVCGHSRNMECHKANLQLYCQETVEMKLDLCGHNQFVLCKFTQMSERHMITCKAICSHMFDCGHTCKRTCHKEEGPHDKNSCQEPCELVNKSCPRKHLCQRKCGEPCGECQAVVEKTLPCEHKAKMKCHEDMGGYSCNKNCSRKLACGHACMKKCRVSCGPCVFPVEKTVDECGHKQICDCSAVATRSNCKEPCAAIRSCGHQCLGKCKEICEVLSCTVLVDVQLDCGHQAQVTCSTSVKQDLLRLTKCHFPCKATLPCGHMCEGTCLSCLEGRVHAQCRKKCHKQLLCGHNCKSNCNHLVHVCLVQRCMVKYWRMELGEYAPVEPKPKKLNRSDQNPIELVISSLQKALTELVAKMKKRVSLQKQFECGASGDFIKILKATRETRRQPLDDHLCRMSNLKTRLFQVEFACVVYDTWQTMKDTSLMASDGQQYKILITRLLKRVAQQNVLSPNEIAQLQMQIMWLRTVVEIHKFGNSTKGAVHAEALADMLERLNAAKTHFNSLYLSKIITEFKIQLGIVMSDESLQTVFPVSSRLCQPTRQHEHLPSKSTKNSDMSEAKLEQSKEQSMPCLPPDGKVALCTSQSAQNELTRPSTINEEPGIVGEIHLDPPPRKSVTMEVLPSTSKDVQGDDVTFSAEDVFTAALSYQKDTFSFDGTD